MLLARQQRAHVRQQLVRAYRTVAVIAHQTIYHLIDPAQLIGIGRLSRSRNLHDIFQVGKDLLLNCLFQTLVRVVFKLLAFACVGRNANQNLLTESILRVLGDPDRVRL